MSIKTCLANEIYLRERTLARHNPKALDDRALLLLLDPVNRVTRLINSLRELNSKEQWYLSRYIGVDRETLVEDIEAFTVVDIIDTLSPDERMAVILNCSTSNNIGESHEESEKT